MEVRRKTLRPHPMRERIIDTMRSYGKPISPTQVQRIVGASLGSVAYHMRTLAQAGVIELADEGRVRGAVEHYYALVIDDAESATAMLLAMCGALTVPSAKGGYPKATVIDDEASDELVRIVERLRPKVQAIALASTARAE